MKLDVIFRSCSEVQAVHGNGRPLGADKSEVLLRCLNSIIKSLKAAQQKGPAFSVRLTILDDHSRPACLDTMGSLLDKSGFAFEIINLAERGNGASIAACLHWARTHAEDLFYLVEDDYLHEVSAISEMLDAYARAGLLVPERDPVIFPCDYPDRYQSLYPSRVFLGAQRYWRTVLHTTGTFLTSRRNLEHYWHHYLEFSNYGIKPGISEDSTINRIYREVVCLSPMPSLTKHMHEGLDSPFVPWTSWWEQAALEQGTTL